jgi:hypothetical protein
MAMEWSQKNIESQRGWGTVLSIPGRLVAKGSRYSGRT